MNFNSNSFQPISTCSGPESPTQEPSNFKCLESTSSPSTRIVPRKYTISKSWKRIWIPKRVRPRPKTSKTFAKLFSLLKSASTNWKTFWKFRVKKVQNRTLKSRWDVITSDPGLTCHSKPMKTIRSCIGNIRTETQRLKYHAVAIFFMLTVDYEFRYAYDLLEKCQGPAPSWIGHCC